DQNSAGEVVDVVVINLVQGVAALDVNRVWIHIAGNVGEDVPRDPIIRVADVEPDAVRMPDVTHHVISEQQIPRPMHLRPARLRQPSRILPADPLKQVPFHHSGEMQAQNSMNINVSIVSERVQASVLAASADDFATFCKALLE